MRKKPISKTKTKMLPKWALVSLGIILFLIAVIGVTYFTSGHLFMPSASLIIQDVAVSDITATSAVITWTTDKPATSQAAYGSTADFDQTTACDEKLVTSHRVEITKIEPNATYYFRVLSRNARGKEAKSDMDELTTLPLDITPPTISKLKVAGYTGDTATITWETDEEATSQVEYGNIDTHGNLATSDGELRTSHSIELTGLQANTTYHFNVESTDRNGNQTKSEGQVFTNWIAVEGWAKYVNEEYGFSIQYPQDWIARPELVTRSTYHYLAVFSVEYFVPGLCVAVFDAEQPISEDWAIEAYKKMDDRDIKVVSPLTETTLSDGTQATTYKIKYVPLHMPNQAEDYEYTSYCLDADKSGKRIHLWVSTVEWWDPYNEALFSQIAHTLRFSTK
jgi:hypothetical protein